MLYAKLRPPLQHLKTGVRQGCLMSALLVNIDFVWVLRRKTEDHSGGIQWTLFSTLEDLDFVDDLALVFHAHQHIREKTSHLITYILQIGLKISQKNTEVMALSIANPSPVQVNGKDLCTTVEFTYLASTVRYYEGAGSDIKNRLSKAKNAFTDNGMLNGVWRSQQNSTKPKLKLYQSYVLSTLL